MKSDTEQVDFTIMRKGARWRKGTLQVDYCPKCGRKGLHKRSGYHITFIHTAEVDPMFGLILHDYCKVK